MVRKSYPAQISVNMLSELTGKDRKTITRRLEGLEPEKSKKKGNYYDLKTALKLVFEPVRDELEDDDDGLFINGMLEKAKLDRARRIGVELENEIKKKTLIPREELSQVLQKMFGAVRAKLLNVPLKATQSMPEKPNRKQLEAHLKKAINEALRDLSEKNVYESL